MTCEQCQQLLPLYALGGLNAAELEAVRAHLASGCPACAAALAEAETLLAKIPESLEPVAPSAAVREKLMAKVRETESAPGSIPLRKPAPPASPADTGANWLWAFGGAIAAGLIVGITLWVVNAQQRDIFLGTLKEQNKKIEAINQANTIARNFDGQQLKAYSTVLAALQAKGSKVFELPGKEQPDASGRVVFDPAAKKYYLLTSGLKPLPEGKIYELWLIDDKGAVAAGTFIVGEGGMAILGATPEREVVPTTIAVTDETAPGGSAPKGQIQIAGKI